MDYISEYIVPYLSQFQIGDYVGHYKGYDHYDTCEIVGDELVGVFVVVDKNPGGIPNFNPWGIRIRRPYLLLRSILTDKEKDILSEYLSDQYWKYDEKRYAYVDGTTYRTPLEFYWRKINKTDVVTFLNEFKAKKEKEAEEERRKEEEKRRRKEEKERKEREEKEKNDQISEQYINDLADMVKQYMKD